MVLSNPDEIPLDSDSDNIAKAQTPQLFVPKVKGHRRASGDSDSGESSGANDVDGAGATIDLDNVDEDDDNEDLSMPQLPEKSARVPYSVRAKAAPKATPKAMAEAAKSEKRMNRKVASTLSTADASARQKRDNRTGSIAHPETRGRGLLGNAAESKKKLTGSKRPAKSQGGRAIGAKRKKNTAEDDGQDVVVDADVEDVDLGAARQTLNSVPARPKTSRKGQESTSKGNVEKKEHDARIGRIVKRQRDTKEHIHSLSTEARKLGKKVRGLKDGYGYVVAELDQERKLKSCLDERRAWEDMIERLEWELGAEDP